MNRRACCSFTQLAIAALPPPCPRPPLLRSCCDGIFLPSLFVKNAYGLSQDRLLYENI